MRTHRLLGVLACSGLMIAAAPGVEARQVTPSDVWSAAASTATASIYQPSEKVLDRLKLYGGSPTLAMTCAGEWNVQASYSGESLAQGSTPTQFDLYQSTKNCTQDGQGNDVKPNTSSVTVVGAKVVIIYLDCFGTAQDQATPEEAACPVAQRIYSASGILPGAGDKKPTRVQVDTRGLSRAQVGHVIRSLRPVG